MMFKRILACALNTPCSIYFRMVVNSKLIRTRSAGYRPAVALGVEELPGLLRGNHYIDHSLGNPESRVVMGEIRCDHAGSYV